MISLDDERARCAATLPAGAACEACGEGDPLVLNSDDRMILCAECDAIREASSRLSATLSVAAPSVRLPCEYL